MADAAERIFEAVRDAPQKGAPLYLQLRRSIEEAVNAGVIGPGDALPSERDIAVKADVSRVTVRKAVQDPAGILAGLRARGIASAADLKPALDYVARVETDADDGIHPRMDDAEVVERAERLHVLVKLALRRFRDASYGLVQGKARILLGRPRVDLVVDVGDVADIGHVLGAVEMAQQPVEHIEHDHGPRIADMRAIIDRRSAHIEGDALGIAGDELTLLARHRVVEADHDAPPPTRRCSTQSTIARPLALSKG